MQEQHGRRSRPHRLRHAHSEAAAPAVPSRHWPSRSQTVCAVLQGWFELFSFAFALRKQAKPQAWATEQIMHRGWARRQASRLMTASPPHSHRIPADVRGPDSLPTCWPMPAFHTAIGCEAPESRGTMPRGCTAKGPSVQPAARNDSATRWLCVQRLRCTARPLAPTRAPTPAACHWHVHHCVAVLHLCRSITR